MQPTEDMKHLDELLATLGGATDSGKQSRGPCGLLLEHLESARRNLLGSRTGEYRASLRDAGDSVACILDKGVRSRASKTLRDLIEASK